MRIAVDRNDNRIMAEFAVSREDYYCETCGKPVSLRNGIVKAKHFAHLPSHPCNDSWNTGDKKNTYDISEWHVEWQKNYPHDNIEIVLSNGDIRHRADVLIGRCVIEFQHSEISSKHFQERTNFYLNLNYKLIWLFDVTEDYVNNKISCGGNVYRWLTPKTTFRDVTADRDNLDIFFQISNDKIVRVKRISEIGFEAFETDKSISCSDFLEYTGLVDGKCKAPDVEDAYKLRDDLKNFIKKYSITLDKNQQRAVQTVDGANLVLAIPGSGKTTVLTCRLGYMSLVRGIEPEHILAITFTKNAANEMKKRIKRYFKNEIVGEFDIRTINSLSLKIVKEKYNFNTISGGKARKYLIDTMKKYGISCYEDDIKLYSSAICYVKSKLNREKAFADVVKEKNLVRDFERVFNEYNQKLRDESLIDFNDQNIIALEILKENADILEKYRNMYRYVCVDEAQDTNQIQYELIKLIAGSNNNIFMVGDEDQSIYGFNGSYPEALLNFRDEYKNPFILRLERNYRSVSQIVDASKIFIDKNTKRNPKDSYSYRGKGDRELVKIPIHDAMEQAECILDEVKSSKKQIAILFRENICAVPLLIKLLENNIDYSFLGRRKNDDDDSLFDNMQVSKFDVFSSSNFKKVFSLLKLAYDPKDFEVLTDICWALKFKKIPDYFVKLSKEKVVNGLSNNVFDAVISTINEKGKIEYQNANNKNINAMQTIKSIVSRIRTKDANEAIDYCVEIGSSEYQKERMRELFYCFYKEGMGLNEYVSSLIKLKDEIEIHDNHENSNVILSTFHGAKGMEFDSVYLIDVYDDMCPSILPTDNFKLYEEERRLFYVAITRAKNELLLFKNINKNCSFVDELVPDPKVGYTIKYVDAENGGEISSSISGEAKLGDTINVTPRQIDGFVTNTGVSQYRLENEQNEIVIYYERQKVIVNYYSMDTGELLGSIILESSEIGHVNFYNLINVGEREIKTIYYDSKYVVVKKGSQSIVLDYVTREKVINLYVEFLNLRSLLEIAEEEKYRKVIVVEDNNGNIERITGDIQEMHEYYNMVYGDNGAIKNYNDKIWKVKTKL